MKHFTFSFIHAQSLRKPSHADYSNSPPTQSGGYFPHDLDDIYEGQNDHQYFTYSGASNQRNSERPSINSIFHRVGAAPASLDEYASSPMYHSLDGGAGLFPRRRFDNNSFVRSISINEDDDSTSTSSPKEHKHKHKDHHHHHHHSIQEMLKTFGKKVHIWPRKSHDNAVASSVCTSPQNDPQENFRSRSKSLDVNTLRRPNRILEDCGATYKIYDKIVKEGNMKGKLNVWCCKTWYLLLFVKYYIK